MSQETPPPINPDSKSTSMGFVGNLTKNAGTAAKLVGLQAERTKLTTLKLPAAYRALGKDCIQQNRHLDDVKELIEQFRTVTSELSSLAETPKADSSKQSFTDKAKAAGKQAVDLARKKQLEMKRESLCGDVGKAIYETHKESSGSKDLVTPIQAALNRVTELDSEIAKVEKGSWITRKYLLFMAAGIAVTVIVALFFRRGSETQSEGPYIPGTSHKYLQVLYPGGDSDPIVELKQFICGKNGEVEITTEKIGRLIDPNMKELSLENVTWLKDSSVKSKLYRRITDGFIEIGSPRYSDGKPEWERVFMIGAKTGDKWTDKSEYAEAGYEVTKEEKWKGKKAVVIRQERILGNSNQVVIVFTTYVKGIGIVDEMRSLVQPGGIPPIRTTSESILIE